MTRKFQKELLGNALLIAAEYVGLFGGLTWLAIAAAALVWTIVASYLAVYLAKDAKKHTTPDSRWMGLVIDAIVLFGWFYHGWYITGIAYLASTILLELIYRRGRGLPDHSRSARASHFGQECETDSELGERVTQFLGTPTKSLGFALARVPLDERADFLLGFLSAASDLVAQHLGAERGGHASLNGAIQTMTDAFGEERGAQYVMRATALSLNPSRDFAEGQQVGARWANALALMHPDVAASIVFETIGPRYWEHADRDGSEFDPGRSQSKIPTRH